MIHFGPAGAFGAPRQKRLAEPDPDQFRVGDIWENSIGTPHRVIRIENGRAHFVNLKTGRTANRGWSDTGWTSGRPWIRISWGGK